MRAGLSAALEVAPRFGEHDGIDERRLGRKAPVQGRAADAAAARDVFHGDAAHSDEFGLLDRGGQIRAVISSGLATWARTAGSGSVRRRTNSAVRVVVTRFLLAVRRGRRIVAIEACETLIVLSSRMSHLAGRVARGRELMRVGLWVRWAAMHGVPRAFLAVRARRRRPVGSAARQSRTRQRSLPADGGTQGAGTAGTHTVHMGERRPWRLPRNSARQKIRCHRARRHGCRGRCRR